MFCYSLIFRHDLLVSLFFDGDFFKKRTVVLMNDLSVVFVYSFLVTK